LEVFNKSLHSFFFLRESPFPQNRALSAQQPSSFRGLCKPASSTGGRPKH